MPNGVVSPDRLNLVNQLLAEIDALKKQETAASGQLTEALGAPATGSPIARALVTALPLLAGGLAGGGLRGAAAAAPGAAAGTKFLDEEAARERQAAQARATQDLKLAREGLTDKAKQVLDLQEGAIESQEKQARFEAQLEGKKEIERAGVEQQGSLDPTTARRVAAAIQILPRAQKTLQTIIKTVPHDVLTAEVIRSKDGSFDILGSTKVAKSTLRGLVLGGNSPEGQANAQFGRTLGELLRALSGVAVREDEREKLEEQVMGNGILAPAAWPVAIRFLQEEMDAIARSALASARAAQIGQGPDAVQKLQEFIKQQAPGVTIPSSPIVKELPQLNGYLLADGTVVDVNGRRIGKRKE